MQGASSRQVLKSNICDGRAWRRTHGHQHDWFYALLCHAGHAIASLAFPIGHQCSHLPLQHFLRWMHSSHMHSGARAGSKPTDTSKQRQLFLQLLLLLGLHSAATALFACGFLLTRVELQRFSACTDLSDSSVAALAPATSGDGPTNSSTGCWGRQHFDKAVIIIIDALRYDFAVPPDGSSGNIPVLLQLAREAVTALRMT